MVKLSEISLFTRLYISIALSLLLTTSATIWLVDRDAEQQELQYFVSHTDYAFQALNNQLGTSPTMKLKQFSQTEFLASVFTITIVKMGEHNHPCEQCDLIGVVDDVQVYVSDQGVGIAAYPLAKYQSWFLVSDNPTYEIDDNDEEIAGVPVELILWLIILSTIGISIYWSLGTFQLKIKNLIKTQQRFGQGQLSERANEALPKPFNQLANSFNHMANSISDTVKENQIFAQAVPHEIRTPLSRIQLAAGLLRKLNENEQAVELLDNIDTYINDIDELISQVVAFSRLNSITDNDEDEFDYYQTIDCKAFVESRVNTVAKNSTITVDIIVTEAIEITTNPVYLRLVIDNLLKNALNYAKSAVTIIIIADKEHIDIIIEDDGIGIAPEHFETIFYPFSRLDQSRSRETGGLGLGLAIVKAATKRMNCQLTVTNNRHGGAKFSCAFNRQPNESSPHD
ncbi:MAG: ATP-binding protein [Gammaproteobacteria bacterium]|nr:ATP-binding protein [Gammaproteobacteria bacterium]